MGIIIIYVLPARTVVENVPKTSNQSASKAAKKKKAGGKATKPSNKRAKTVGAVDSSALSATESEVEEVKPAVSFQISTPVPEVSSPAVEKNASEESTASEEKEKKSKKAKETPAQKESRLKRQKEHKALQAVNAPTVSESIVPEAVVPVFQSFASAPAPFDGWAVVEEKRKGKGKKPEDGDATSSDAATLLISSSSSPVPPSASAAAEEESGEYKHCQYLYCKA